MMSYMKKFISLFIALILILLASVGCTKTGKNDRFYNEKDPIQVVDGAGRKISFPAPAETVATSWGGGIDNYLFALGVVDRIAATNSHGYFEEKFFNPENMTKVGKWALDKEALAEVSPDLYLHGYCNTDYIDGANKVGVRAYGMGFHTFEDIEKNLIDLGVLFGIEDRAQYVCGYCKGIRELIESRVKDIPEVERPTVLVLGEKTGELASDVFDTVDEMTELAGGISSTPEDLRLKTETTIVGLENIFKWNPDFIFLKDNRCELTVDGIMSDPTWQSMTSVKDGHVFAIPSTMDTWCNANPSCYLGALYMSMQMYPELYEDIVLENLVVDFYHEVYNIDLTIEEIGIE